MSYVQVPRAALPAGAWDAFVAGHPGGWWWHTTHWLDYCLAYHAGAADRSVALLRDGRLRAVVPLVQEAGAFQMGGHPGAWPLALDGLDLDAAWGAVRLAADDHGALVARFRAHPGAAGFGVQPPPDYATGGWQTYVLDLTRDEAELWRGVRRSYRALVHRAERERDLVVTHRHWGVAIGRHLHRLAAGRETRSERTWQLMADWAEAGHALTALVSHRQPRLEGLDHWSGFAYVVRWKDWAYYASGATTEPDTAHALQWRLIRTLRCGDARRYELGWAAGPEADAKARGIAHFKAGWGGDLWPVAACERAFSRANEGSMNR